MLTMSTLSRKTLAKVPVAIIVLACIILLWRKDISYFDLSTPSGASTTQQALVPVPSAVQCPPPPPQRPIAKLGNQLFPDKDPSRPKSWVKENHNALQSLFGCLENSNCGRNQTKVIILGSYHFRGALVDWNGGEDIWCRSTILALKNMGYTFLYSLNNERTVQLYQMFPHLVKAVILEGDETFGCFEDEDNCILSEKNKHGIPVWKILTIHWWTGDSHPLGHQWTLWPEDYTLEGKGYIPNSYLGYSIEPGCAMRPFVPHSERENRGYVMAKRLSFFAPSDDQAWDLDFYDVAANATGVEFIVGADSYVPPHEGPKPIPTLPPSLKNVGILPQDRFYEEVSKSKVLIGVGLPFVSPTPYDALCLGVPFINPIMNWDHDNPTNKDGWWMQHGLLKLLDPPYVYNVQKGDQEGFVKAIQDAISNPIDSLVLPHMRMGAVEQRLGALLERDWKTEATALFAERQKSGEGTLFVL